MVYPCYILSIPHATNRRKVLRILDLALSRLLILPTISLTISMTSKSEGLRGTKIVYFFNLSLCHQTTYTHSLPLYRQSPSESIGFLTQPLENTKLRTNFRGPIFPKCLRHNHLRQIVYIEIAEATPRGRVASAFHRDTKDQTALAKSRAVLRALRLSTPF